MGGDNITMIASWTTEQIKENDMLTASARSFNYSNINFIMWFCNLKSRSEMGVTVYIKAIAG